MTIKQCFLSLKNTYLRKGSFVTNFFTLMLGTVVAQSITIVVSPVLTRLYGPSDFGIYGVYASIVSIVSAFITLRFDQALMLPKKNDDASNLFMLSIAVVCGITILSVIVVSVLQRQLANLTKFHGLLKLIWIMPLSLFLTGLYQACNSWSTRRKFFHRSSTSQMTRAITASSLQIATGIKKCGAVGLIGSAIIGDFCAMAVLVKHIYKNDWPDIKKSFSLQRMRCLAREYLDFPVYSSSQGVMNSISQNIPVLLLAYYFGSAIAGFYALAIRVLQFPVNLIAASLRQVFFQKASETYNAEGDTYYLFKKITLILLAIAAIPTIIIVLFAPNIFCFILGKQWFTAGVYARWLVLWLFLLFANVPSILFAQVYRKQRGLLWFDVSLLICRVSVLILGGIYFNALLTIISYSIVGVVFNAIIIIYMRSFLRKKN